MKTTFDLNCVVIFQFVFDHRLLAVFMCDLPVVSTHEKHAVDGEDELHSVPGHHLGHQPGLEVESLLEDLGQCQQRVEGGEAQPDQEVAGPLSAQNCVAHGQSEGRQDAEEVGQGQTDAEEAGRTGVEAVQVRDERDGVVAQLHQGDQPGGGGEAEQAQAGEGIRI